MTEENRYPPGEEIHDIITTQDLHQFMDELQAMAVNLLRQQWNTPSMQASDLVQSAFRRQGLKNQRLDELTWKNRKHFFGAMYQAMKRALQDHARKRNAGKRQIPEGFSEEHQLHNESPEHFALMDEDFNKRQRWRIIQINDLELRDLKRTLEQSPEQISALIEALEELETKDPECAEVVQHRVFGGLTLADTATMMDGSIKTVQRKWNRSWTWLHHEVRNRVNAAQLS